ncbi:MAG: hypothetical protein ACK56F_32855, partial [bacterium]
MHRPEHGAQEDPQVAGRHAVLVGHAEEEKARARERDAGPDRPADPLAGEEPEERHEDDVEARDECAARRRRATETEL